MNFGSDFDSDSEPEPRKIDKETLNTNQKLIFARLVFEHRGFLFGKLTPKVTKKVRDGFWTQIHDQMKAHGLKKITLEQLRFSEWENLRKTVRRHYDNTKKSGAKGKKLTELDNIVLDVIGRDETHTVGLPMPDPPPVFDGERQNVVRPLSTTNSQGASQNLDRASLAALMPPPRNPPPARPSFELNLNRTITNSERSFPGPSSTFVPIRSSSPLLDTESLADQTLPSIDNVSVLNATQLRQSEFIHRQNPASQPQGSSLAPRPNMKRRRIGSLENLLQDEDYKGLKKEIMSLKREHFLKDQDEQELRIERLRQQVDE